MSKTRPALLALALLAALACAGGQLRSVEPPDVRLANLVPLDATLFEQHLRLDLRIVNPNDFTLRLGGIRFDLALDEDVVARGASELDTDVPRLGDAVVSVETTTSSMALVRQILKAPTRDAMNYRLSGEILLRRALRRSVPFEYSGRLPLRAAAGAP